jgi:DNA repair ATPase RecN
MGMQKIDYVKMVKDVWNVDITKEEWEELEKKYPKLANSYNLQKQIWRK